METRQIGLLHPGEMGVSIAGSAQRSGYTVLWASEGRSPATRARAERLGLRDVGSLASLVAACPTIVCVCPPHAAEGVAAQVLAAGFRGRYLDANAIAPQRALAIGEAMARAGATFVDGGIIGGPAWEAGRTWLYLSGPDAERLAACFSAGPLQTSVLGPDVGAASALKMCYAAYSKGTTALLAAILASAEDLGVREALAQQWERDQAGFADATDMRVRRVTAKAWRFVGEMEEIAATFQAAGQPGGFHQAAAEVYRRLAYLKGAAETPALDEVLAALRPGAPPAQTP